MTAEVLEVTITVNEEKFLDLEAAEMKDEVMALYEKNHKGANLRTTDISKIHETVIKNVEKALGYALSVFQVRLAAPHSYPNYPLSLGAPLCYVVRDSNCITIDSD